MNVEGIAMSRLSRMHRLLIVFSFLVVSIMHSPSVTASAPNYIFIYINGKQFASTVGEAIPFTNEKNRVMVPVRILTYFQVSIDDIQQNFGNGSVNVNTSKLQLNLKVNDRLLKVNGKVIEMDSVPAQVRTSLFVPVRSLCESLGAKVHFSKAKNHIYITWSPLQ